MGHGKTEHDRILSVRQPTWHGLEDLWDDYPTREEAEKLVHDWQVIREPLYRKVYGIKDGEPYEEFVLYEDEELNVRSDTGMPLASVPKPRVEVQPSEVWDLAELIQNDDKNILIETAGSLNGGRDIWILIKLDEPVTVNGDPQGLFLPYFALQNSYAPGAAFRGQATNVRIVCWNTSRASDMIAEAQGVNFAFRHGANLKERVEEIREALAGWRASINEFRLAKEFMLTQKVTTDQTNWFVEHFIPEPHGALTSERVKTNIQIDRAELIMELYSERQDGIRGTALSLFEAASSWNEHIRRAQSPLTRFKRAVLEPTDVLAAAHSLALDAVNV